MMARASVGCGRICLPLFFSPAARLQQVLWNLFKNASKFTPEGETIEIRCRCLPDRDYVVEVADLGIGMEAEALARIFQPFEQANVSIMREFGGLGPELVVAKATARSARRHPERQQPRIRSGYCKKQRKLEPG